jgi:hypothetical protein
MDTYPDINNQERETRRKKQPLYRPHTASTKDVATFQADLKQKPAEEQHTTICLFNHYPPRQSACVLVKPLGLVTTGLWSLPRKMDGWIAENKAFSSIFDTSSP